jgi:predicted TIM-barrel fold metal-dependent hydrolase
VTSVLSNPNASDERALFISSDGHASAQMPDYRPYLPERYRKEFDAFCDTYRERGSRNFEPKNLLIRLDSDVVEDWIEQVLKPGRTAGLWDPAERIKEMESEGVVSEVLFPDFGLPFELYAPKLAARMGYVRTQEQIDVGNLAYNRWLAEFCQHSPERFIGMASLSFSDVEETLKAIREAKKSGLRGVVLPAFPDHLPLFSPSYEPIWSLLEELEMPVNSHIGISSTTKTIPAASYSEHVPHPTSAGPMFNAQFFFFCQQILTHMIWGGVLERHPNLKVVFTEMGSGWVIGALAGMDYSYERSYLRRDVREVVRRRPSEYFERQCFLGSSLFSLAEAQARHDIGVGKISIGVDYPHHEGTWGVGPGTPSYLQATLGVAGVPPEEARLMLGENAAGVWGVDLARLREVADRVGPPLASVLAAPSRDNYPRGDVAKPLTTPF